MKKILVLAVVLFGLSGCGDFMNNNGDGKQVGGGLTNSTNPLYEPEYYYEIDTWGTNADVWEFTPKGNPSYICINVGAGAGRALQCIPKGN